MNDVYISGGRPAGAPLVIDGSQCGDRREKEQHEKRDAIDRTPRTGEGLEPQKDLDNRERDYHK
jgi:hypothetical protein